MAAGRRPRRGILRAALICCACAGCGSAHYVLRNPDNGIVAISTDTPELRAKAEKLMHEQFPGGFVIDDVRVVPVGRPYQTITRVGGFTEIDTHRRHEVMLYYHAGQPAPVMPVRVGAPVVTVATSPGPVAPPPVQPASLTAQPSQQAGLPSQPVPIK
jgi:hypothetical protein